MKKNKEEGISYNIIGNGIMVADAEEVRKYAKHQFDNCNEYFNKQQECSMHYKVEFEKAVFNMLWIWRQYNMYKSMETEFVYANMRAGENATDFLIRHGYGEDDGYSFVLNEKGIKLMSMVEKYDE